MKKLLLSVAAVALSVGSAVAADLPSRKAPPAYIPPPPPVLTWTGLYAGLNIGGGWMERYNNDFGLAYNGIGWNAPYYAPGLSSPGGGVIGGGQIGYNYQLTPMFVVGLEADIQGTSMGGSNNMAPWSAPSRAVQWFGTVRGRIGASVFSPQLLVYGTGGFAYGDLRLNNGPFGSMVETATGWTAGGGAEYAILPNWSVKGEYLYTNIGAYYPGTQGLEHRIHFHTIRAGVNYKFNWGASAPVMAGY